MTDPHAPREAAQPDHPSIWGVVVIGCSWGANLARAVARGEQACVLAVVDLDLGKAERLAAEVAATPFTDYRQALEHLLIGA